MECGALQGTRPGWGWLLLETGHPEVAEGERRRQVLCSGTALQCDGKKSGEETERPVIWARTV